LFQGPRVHFQLDTEDSEQQILDLVTPPVKVPVSAGMRSPMKSYSTAEIKSTIGLSNDVNKMHGVSKITLEQVPQSDIGTATQHCYKDRALTAWIPYEMCCKKQIWIILTYYIQML
jgi:hypothetical protein